jgi:hypothetical protein
MRILASVVLLNGAIGRSTSHLRGSSMRERKIAGLEPKLEVQPLEAVSPPESYSGVSLDASTSQISLDLGVQAQPVQTVDKPCNKKDYSGCAWYLAQTAAQEETTTTSAPTVDPAVCNKKNMSGCPWAIRQAEAELVNTPPPTIAAPSPSVPVVVATSPSAVLNSEPVQPVLAAVLPAAGGMTSTTLESKDGLSNIAFHPPTVSYSNAFTSYTPPEFSITPCASSNNYAEGGCDAGSSKFKVNMNTAVASLR